MIGFLREWFKRPARLDGQSCATCAYGIDYRDMSEPGEVDVYCSHADKSDSYGGHWTCSDDWCRDWKAAPND